MAATTRALTPTLTRPFSAPNGPKTPASTPHDNASFGPHLTKSPAGLSPGTSPQPLSGTAALAEERRYRARGTTPNPSLAALQTLAGHHQTSPMLTAPPVPQMTCKQQKAVQPIAIPENPGVMGENMQTSPVSLSSFGDGDSTTAPGAATVEGTANGHAGARTGGAHPVPPPPQHQLIAPNPTDHPGSRAFTFPGPMPPEPDPRAPARQMSLPGYGQPTPKSPSTKRHKCPYCATDFTRHHNLKSHLLTHSKEKPYKCTNCQACFRRLHDLKRHTKLHTGERPHTCFQCGRRFARGDALARHNKGQGGCAGRRSSFGMEDDMGDGRGEEGMDGVVYAAEADEDDDDAGRRESEPARKRQNTGNASQALYLHSSTYPPIAASRPSDTQNHVRPYHPTPSTQASNASPKQGSSSLSSIHGAGQPNVFAQGGMTESPKPLSPGQQEQMRLGASDGSLHGPRSPGMSQHRHQQNFARGRGTPPVGLGLPNNSTAPHLPALPGLNPLAPKQASHAAKGSALGLLPHPPMGAPATPSQPGSVSSHGGSGSSMREIMGGQDGVWQIVREIESRMARMEKEHLEKILTMQTEITTLRAQLAQRHVNEAQAPRQAHQS